MLEEKTFFIFYSLSLSHSTRAKGGRAGFYFFWTSRLSVRGTVDWTDTRVGRIDFFLFFFLVHSARPIFFLAFDFLFFCGV
jgi:hypothetical protein